MGAVATVGVGEPFADAGVGDEAHHLGLAQRATELPSGQNVGEVDQRAVRLGHRDPEAPLHVTGGKPARAMYPDPRRRAPVTNHDDIDGPSVNAAADR